MLPLILVLLSAAPDDGAPAPAPAPAPAAAPAPATELVLTLNAPDGSRPEYRVQFGPTAPVTSLAFDAATKRLYAAQGDRVRVWDLAAAASLEPLAHAAITEPIRAIALSADGKHLAAASGRPATLVLFPTAPGAEPIVRKDAGPEINALALSTDGAFVAAGLVDGSTRVWKTADLSPVTLPDAPPGPAPGSIADVAFSPDSQHLASVSRDGSLLLREVGSWKAMPPIGHGSPAAALVFTDNKADGLAIASGRVGEGTRIVLRRREAPPATNDQAKPLDAPPYSTVARTLPTTGGLPMDLACIPSTRRLYAAGTVPALRVLSADNAGTIATLPGHGSPLFAVAASPELARVASADADGLIMLWDAGSNARLATLIAPQGTSDDWVILTDRGPARGPGLGRVHRAGSDAALQADDKGVQALLVPPSKPPAAAPKPK